MNFLKSRIFKVIIIFASLFFTLGFYYTFHLPQLKKWAIVKIYDISKAQLPFVILTESIDVNLFPFGVIARNIKATPKKELNDKITNINIKEVHIYLSYIDLIVGDLKFSAIKFIDPKINIILKEKDLWQKTPKTQTNNAFPFDYKQIDQLPLGRIEIQNMWLLVKIDRLNHSLFTKNLNLVLQKQTDSLFFDLSVPHLNIKKNKQKNKLNLSFSTRFLINNESLLLTNLSIKEKHIEFKSNGKISGDFLHSKISSFKVKSNLNANLSHLEQIKNYINQDIQLPKLTGKISLNTLVDNQSLNKGRIKFEFGSKKVAVNNFIIGDLHTDGTLNRYSKNKFEVNLKKLKLKNSSGHITLDKFNLNIAEKTNFSTDLVIHDLELKQLLKNLTVGEIPLHLDISGKAKCDGEIVPNLLIKCEPTLTAENLSVHSGEPDKFAIVDVETLDANGSVTINNQQVEYKAKLKLPTAQGASHGVISYKKGFNIHYEGTNVNFKDIKNLAQLKFEGAADVKGRTWGNTSFGRIQLKAKSKNLWLEDYKLGDSSFSLGYKAGTLNIKNIKGKIKSSQYTGDVSIFLKNSTIKVHGYSPFLDASDLKSVFDRKVDLPFSVSGTGSATLNVFGPLQFNRLSYDLDSSFYRGQVAKESFDVTRFQVVSKKGFVKSKSIYLKKGSGTIRMSGTANPDGQIKLLISGNQLFLKEFEHVNQLGININGNLNFTSQLTGHILSPDSKSKGILSNVYFDNEPLLDSFFQLELNNKRIAGSNSIFGNKIISKFNIPKVDNEPFFFQLKTNNFNFLNFFSIFNNSELRKFYDSKLNANINLYSKSGDPWESNGFLNINDIFVERGNKTLKSHSPLLIEFENGKAKAAEFEVLGGNSFVKFKLLNFEKSSFNTETTGNIDLSLITLLTPLDELKGPMSFSLKTSGPALSPKILGSSYSKNAYVKFPGFNHPFEKINYDLLFNEKHLVLNSAMGQLAGGDFNASGRVQFKKFKNIPVNISGQINNTTLSVIDGIKVKGSGEVKFSGNWFPYELATNFIVDEGLIDMEFNSSGASKTPSYIRLLPQILTNDSFDPIHLNINAQFFNPIIVKNSQFDGRVTGQLNILGTPYSPLLTGNITATQGEINFRDNIFNISHANIIYNNSLPEQPSLDVVALTQFDDEDFTYDIKLTAQGVATKPEIQLSSQPPLQHNEIVSLLALGVSNTEIDKKNIDEQELANQTTYQIGSAILASPIGKQVKSKFGVDVQISSDIDDSNTSVPKFTLKKQLTKKFSAAASRTIEKAPKNDVKFKYNFNKNFSVIGLYDSVEEDSTDNVEKSNFGVDVEYKINFK
jgi:translocation and assembly module TamB